MVKFVILFSYPSHRRIKQLSEDFTSKVSPFQPISQVIARVTSLNYILIQSFLKKLIYEPYLLYRLTYFFSLLNVFFCPEQTTQISPNLHLLVTNSYFFAPVLHPPLLLPHITSSLLKTHCVHEISPNPSLIIIDLFLFL